MTSNTISEEMEEAMLEVAKKHREHQINRFNIQLVALKDKFPNIDNPLLNSWLSYTSNPENLQEFFPEVRPGSPIPSYLLTSRNFTMELAQVVSSLNERAPDIPRSHRRVTTRPSATRAQAGGGSGPTPDQTQSNAGGGGIPVDSTGVPTDQPESSARGGGIPLDSTGVRTDQPESSARGGDNPLDSTGVRNDASYNPLDSTGVRNDASYNPLDSTGVRNDASQSPLNVHNESNFDFNNDSTFGFDDMHLDGNEDDRVEGFGSAQGNVVPNPPNSSVNPGQDSVVPEVEVNPNSSLNRSQDIEFPEVDPASSPLSSQLNAGEPTTTPQDEADDPGATGTAEGDADPMQQGGTAGSSPEAGLNVEYAGYEAHHIPNSSVFGAQHALEAKLLKFTNQQYACMVMNGQKFDLPDNIDRLRVDLCYRNDGSADSDVETGWNSRAAANIKLGETEIEVKKFVHAHWVKWVFKRDADVIIHYLSSGREKKASIIEEMRKEIEELNKTLALRKEELRKLEQDH